MRLESDDLDVDLVGMWFLVVLVIVVFFLFFDFERIWGYIF